MQYVSAWLRAVGGATIAKIKPDLGSSTGRTDGHNSANSGDAVAVKMPAPYRAHLAMTLEYSCLMRGAL